MRLFLIFLFAGFIMKPLLAKPLGKATFHAVGEGLALDINGEGAAVDADLKRDGGKLSGSFSVKLSDFKTGIALRDEHLCKALECGKYPKAVFTLAAFEVRDGETPFSGTLDLHGQTKPFSGTAKVKGSTVSATAKIKLSDFGITPPDYKAAKVSNEVEISVDLAL